MTINEAITNATDSNRHKENDDSASAATNATNTAATNVNKAKSCKGALYYSSYFKAKSRKPLCVGLTRTFPNGPQHIVGETEMKAKMEGKGFKEYRFGCWGYSLYRDRTEGADGQQPEAELPLCIGYEVVYPPAQPLNDGRANAADSESAHSDSDTKQDGNGGFPQRQSLFDVLTSSSEELLRRLNRNADVVASGVANHMHRVGEELKERLYNLLHPYRRPPPPK